MCCVHYAHDDIRAASITCSSSLSPNRPASADGLSWPVSSFITLQSVAISCQRCRLNMHEQARVGMCCRYTQHDTNEMLLSHCHSDTNTPPAPVPHPGCAAVIGLTSNRTAVRLWLWRYRQLDEANNDDVASAYQTYAAKMRAMCCDDRVTTLTLFNGRIGNGYLHRNVESC